MGLVDRLTQLIDDRLWRRIVRISHTEIDDIFTGATGLQLQRIDSGKNLGR